MIYLQYGNYQHAEGEALVLISGSIQRDQRMRAYSKRIRWDISGELIVTDEADLKAAIEALEAAYASDNQDIGLYKTGGEATAHVMLNRNTYSGVRVVAPPSYPVGTGGEGGVFRSYALAVEAEFLVTGAGASNIQQFQETLEFFGTGGPRRTWLVPLEGDPEQQEISQRSTFRVIQSGSATGLLTYPPPPGPFWPEAEHQDERRISRIGPQRSMASGTQLTHQTFTTNWSYTFESIIELQGSPHNE